MFVGNYNTMEEDNFERCGYCEGGYKWEMSEFEDRPYKDWEIWLDINNSPDLSKQNRNDLCKCGSNKKYKKCCYLTADNKLKVWNDKVKVYNTLMKAIENNTSVTLYKTKQLRKMNSSLNFLKHQLNDSRYSNLYSTEYIIYYKGGHNSVN